MIAQLNGSNCAFRAMKIELESELSSEKMSKIIVEIWFWLEHCASMAGRAFRRDAIVHNRRVMMKKSVINVAIAAALASRHLPTDGATSFLVPQRARRGFAHFLVSAALIAVPYPASCQGVLNQLAQATGIPIVKKLGEEGDNAMRDAKQRAPLLAAIATTTMGPVGAFVVSKDQPKEAVVLAAVASSLAVGCSDGCSLGVSALVGVGADVVSVPLGEKKNPSPVSSQGQSTVPLVENDNRTLASSQKLSIVPVEKNNTTLASSQKRSTRARPSSTVSQPALPPLNITVAMTRADVPGMSLHQVPNRPNKKPHQPVNDSSLNAYLVNYPGRQRTTKVGPYLTTYYPPSEGHLNTYAKNQWNDLSTRSQLASPFPGTSLAVTGAMPKAGPNLGDPWFKFTSQYSIQGASGRLSMAKWNAHRGPINSSDFTVNSFLPIVPNGVIGFETSWSTSGLNSVAIVIQDSTGLFVAASLGTTFGGGIPNVTTEARLFNLSAGLKVEPGPGTFNAVGQLGEAVGQLYCSPWGGFCP